MSRITLWFLGGAAFFLMISCNSPKEGTIQKIDRATVKAEVIGKEVQWIDVRTPQEYNAGHIDDAVNFDVKGESFVEQINTLDKNKPIYLYCRRGGRSNRAAEILKSEGFMEIYDYSGGYDEWSANE